MGEGGGNAGPSDDFEVERPVDIDFEGGESGGYITSSPDIGVVIGAVTGNCCSVECNASNYVWNCCDSCHCTGYSQWWQVTALWEGYSRLFNWETQCGCQRVNETNTSAWVSISAPRVVMRGGNSTHVDLFVRHDRQSLDYKVRIGELTAEEAAKRPCGFYFAAAGKHRQREAVSFYVSLSKEGVPVILHDADEILARFEGNDYVGIVPHSVIPKYCESMFPAEYGRVIDFIHVYDEEMGLYGSEIDWLPLDKAELIE